MFDMGAPNHALPVHQFDVTTTRAARNNKWANPRVIHFRFRTEISTPVSSEAWVRIPPLPPCRSLRIEPPFSRLKRSTAPSRPVFQTDPLPGGRPRSGPHTAPGTLTSPAGRAGADPGPPDGRALQSQLLRCWLCYFWDHFGNRGLPCTWFLTIIQLRSHAYSQCVQSYFCLCQGFVQLIL